MKYFTKNFLAVSTLLVALSFTGGNLFAQTFQWVNQFEGTNDQFGQSIDADPLGNVYSGGYFTGDIDIDPSVGVNVLASNGQRDIYISKVDDLGNYVWGLTFGADLDDRLKEIVVDNAGNLYATGYFEDTVDFDPGVGQTLLNSSGGRDIFVLKLDTDGNLIWARNFSGSLDGEGNSIVVNDAQEVFITGIFQGSYDFDPSSGSEILTAQDNRDAFVLKLSPSGNLNWVRQFEGVDREYGTAIDLTSSGEIMVSGFFSGSIDLDPSGASQFFTSAGSFDSYVVKLSSTGNYVWGRNLGGTGQERGEGIVVDNNDDVYVSGRFQNTVNFDPGFSNTTLTAGGALDGYLVKFDNDGIFQWVNHVESTGNCIAFDVSKDPVGDVYNTGYFSGNTNFISQSGTTTITAIGSTDGFIQKIDPAGNELWLYNKVGASGIVPFGLTIASDWSVLTTGFFDGTIDFDPSGTNTSLTSVDAEDAYVHKLSQTCTAPTITGTGTLISMLCPGVQDSTRVYIDGTLNDAVEWAWYEGSCGGTYLGSGDSLTVRPTVTTTYFVRPEGQCGAPVACQTVTVNVDNTAPVITVTTPITVNTDPGTCYHPAANLTPPTVTDVDCGVDTVYNDADLLMLPGLHVVTWTAIDVNGNMSTATQDVTVEDVELPTITAPADVTVVADASCQATAFPLGTPTPNDNCSVASVTNDAVFPLPLGVNTITWTVTDASGNIGTDTQDITVEDQTDPVINGLPADINVNNDAGNCSAVVSWVAPTTTDNCAGATITQIAGITSGNAFPLGTTTVTYEAVDGSGNTVTGSFDVTVTDAENPTITAPIDVTVSAGSNCTASSVALGAETTGDNCGVASVTNDAPVMYPLGTTTVTWTVTDNSGNISTDTQDVIVEDTDAPTVIAPADITVVADGSCQGTVASLGTPVTDDNCSVATVTNDGLAAYPLGNTTVTWTVTDGSGNVSTDVQTITVVDETDPVINGLPADIVVSNDAGVCNAVVNWVEPTVNDNCTGATISQTSGIGNGGSFPVGVTTIEYTATDGSGNTVVETFTVTVNDDEDPIITAAADTTIAANNFCTALNVVLDMPTVSDNCGIQSVTNDAPILYQIDTTTVTWTVTDINGNTATAIQLVIIADSTAPMISAPLPVTAYVDTLCQTTIDTLGTPITSDNCTVDTVYNDAPATYTTGNYVVTWYVEDAAGNIDSATQVVNIIDTILPTPVLTDTTLILDPAGPISLFGSDIDAGSTDNCGLDVVILEQNSFDCDDLGTNTVSVRVIDVNGNVYDTSIVVTVEESGIDLDFDQIDDACDDNINTTTVVVPTGFTPNGDGINDQLVITALSNFSTAHLTVFNRYGNLVYESEQYNNDWDGTNGKNGMELPDGTYFYTLELDGGELLNGYIHINRTL